MIGLAGVFQSKSELLNRTRGRSSGRPRGETVARSLIRSTVTTPA